jgi:hypothetical protein
MKRQAAILCFFALLAIHSDLFSQDTMRIKSADLNTSVLMEGTHNYLVYFTKGKDSARTALSIWSRKIERIDYHGKPAIAVTQKWDATEGVYHTAYSVNDAKTFSSFYHETWWKGRPTLKVNFIDDQVSYNDTVLTKNDTGRIVRTIYNGYANSVNDYFLNWHLDLEVFPTLPFKEGRVFVINFYDPGYSRSAPVAYAVEGSGQLDSYDKEKVDCWILRHTQGRTVSRFWISKKTKEVLKLEDRDTGNNRFRYKLKLGFSD